MNNELEIDSIIHFYGNNKILSDVYLKCQTNDIIGLLGLNGCGKSTLFKIIFGTVRCSNKNIRFNKRPINDGILNKNIISYLPQENFLPFDLKVKDCIKLFIDENILIQEIFNDERIKILLNVKIGKLSGGEKKYLEVLLILNLESDFFLLDEPFSEIEPIYKELIIEKIKNKSRTSGIILSDHDYQNVLNISNKIILLSNGKTYNISKKDQLIKMGYIP